MPPKRKHGTGARLDAWARAQICTMHLLGKTPSEIVATVRKKDGSKPTVGSVNKVVARKRANPSWRGEDSSAGGRPCALTPLQQKRLVKLVFAMRGKAVVTVRFCKRRLTFLRRLRRAHTHAAVAFVAEHRWKAVERTLRENHGVKVVQSTVLGHPGTPC